MSLLNIPTLENASGEVKIIFDEIQNMIGMVPNGIRLWSANPKALKDQWNHIKETLSLDKDTQKLHAILRYLVSEENLCSYCTGFNAGMLLTLYETTQDELKNLNTDLSSAVLNPKNKKLLIFAMKSIKNADSITSNDIESLKEAGITEKELFDIVHYASHMGTVNTLFKTFKVQQD